MKRREALALVVALGAGVGTTGCFAPPDDDLGETSVEPGAPPTTTSPEACPVDTLDDHDPPSDVDRETAASFVRTYESAYIARTEIDEERYERVDGPGTTIDEVASVDGGYRVEVGTGWATWEPDRETLEFERVDGTNVESVSFDDAGFGGNDALREQLERASERDRTGRIPEEHPDYRRTREQIVEAAGEVDGAVIAYGDARILVTESEVPGVHGDHYETAAYHVAPGVVYRTSNPDGDPRDGTVLEC